MRVLPSLAVVALVFALVAPTSAQFRFKGNFGGPPSGGPGGGPGMFGPRDPNQIFDFLAKGRPYFLISDTRSLREPLTQFAKEKGITNEQITREHFAAFFSKMDQYRTPGSMMRGPFSGPGGAPPGSPAGGPTPPSSVPGAPAGAAMNPLDAISQWGEADFRRRDRNGDGQLNSDEMPDSLREQMERWDANHDQLISLDEYRVYFGARLQAREGGDSTRANPVTILIEEDYDQRPTVFRAGKLPKELPKWFSELDTDQDGQVGMYEWRKGNKDLEEFSPWDRNDDGFLTAEEVIAKQRSSNGTTAAAAAVGSSPSMSPRGFDSDRRPGGLSGFGKGGFSGFGRKRDR